MIVVAVAGVLAACGGSGGVETTNSAPDSGGVTSAPATEAASAAPATEAPANATPASTEPPPGAGTALGVCELATADELARIFAVPSVTTTVFVGPPDTCSVESDAGDPLVAWSYSTAQSAAVYDAFAADPSSIQVGGIGDKAAFVQNTGLLVLKGSALSVVSVQSGDAELAKKVGAVVAGRM
ncbi:MAG: hypothetical protein HYX54_07605 [Chloroflexi bacterium]|nr:hypothetical protein [Chloroflexota bacterium]